MNLVAMDQKFYCVRIVLLWTIAVLSIVVGTLPPICKSVCDKPLKNSSVVIQRCGDGTVIDRCCLNSSSLSENEVLGIDLSGCSIHQINDSLLPLHQLETIVLIENPLVGDQESQFSGLLRLEYVSLPPGLNCPGGNGSWENITASDTETVCQGQINLCLADNYTCPQYSHCAANGPGQILCLCDEGYHGYKCLQSGHFQTEAYGLGLGVVTVVLSFFLWITQRRHVKKRD